MSEHTKHYDTEAASLRSQIEQERADFSLVALLGLKPSRDGNMWCFLWGENLTEGVAGFGATIRAAAADFQRACYMPITEKDASHG